MKATKLIHPASYVGKAAAWPVWRPHLVEVADIPHGTLGIHQCTHHGAGGQGNGVLDLVLGLQGKKK